LEVLERVLNQEAEQELYVKKEIAAKIKAGEIVSDAFMKQHAVSVSRVVGHTSIGNFDAKMLTCQDGRETWQVKITKQKNRIWVRYETGHHLSYSLPDFKTKFMNGQCAPPVVGARVMHAEYRVGEVTHVIANAVIEHVCTAHVDGDKRPTLHWECDCPYFANSLRRCDALMYLMVNVHKVDPLSKKLIHPIFDITEHPHAHDACVENGIVPPHHPRTLVHLTPRPNTISVGQYLVPVDAQLRQIQAIRGTNVGSSDRSSVRFHIMKNKFNQVVTVAQQSDTGAAKVVLALQAAYELLSGPLPVAGTAVVDGREVSTHLASGHAPVEKRAREGTSKADRAPGGAKKDAPKKSKRSQTCSFCKEHFGVLQDSLTLLGHYNVTLCTLSKHVYDPDLLRGKWQVSFRSTLSSHWTRDADVEFKFPCGRSISTKIPHERYPSSMAGNTFRLISAGVTNVFSEEHLQRAPLWSAHQMP
jgi:hypothetical protein